MRPKTSVSYNDDQYDVNNLKGCSLYVCAKTAIAFCFCSVAIFVSKCLVRRYSVIDYNSIKDETARCALYKILDPFNPGWFCSLIVIFVLQFCIVDVALTNHLIAKGLDYHSIRAQKVIARLFVVGLCCSLTWELFKSVCETASLQVE